jgi:hypothetical protein
VNSPPVKSVKIVSVLLVALNITGLSRVAQWIKSNPRPISGPWWIYSSCNINGVGFLYITLQKSPSIVCRANNIPSWFSALNSILGGMNE